MSCFYLPCFLKLSNIKLPLTAIIVHVAYLSKHWSFSPTLIMHSTYWPVMQPWSKLGTTFSNISTIGLHDRAFAPGNIKPSIQQYSNNSRQKGGDNDKLRRMRSHFKLLKYQVVRQNNLLGSDTYNPVISLGHRCEFYLHLPWSLQFTYPMRIPYVTFKCNIVNVITNTYPHIH